MNSKIRMQKVFELKQPDRVPFFPTIWVDHACYSCGFSQKDGIKNRDIPYRAVLETSRRYQMDAVRVWIGQGRDWFKENVVAEEGNDLFLIDRKNGQKIGKYDIEGGWGIIPLKPNGFIDHSPTIEGESDLSKVEVLTEQDYFEQGFMEPVLKLIQQAQNDFFIVGMASGQTLNFLVEKRGGPQRALMDLVENPEFARKIMEVGTDISIEKGKALIRAGVDAIYIGDSYSSASVISPAYYKEFCIPLYEKATREFHKKGVYVYKHCCGNYTPLLDLVAQESYDGMEGIDPLCGMNLGYVKAKIGKVKCLMGGMNTMTLLREKPDQVYFQATECLRQGMPEGGYILDSACAVPCYTPVENMLAFSRAAKEKGNY